MTDADPAEVDDNTKVLLKTGIDNASPNPENVLPRTSDDATGPNGNDSKSPDADRATTASFTSTTYFDLLRTVVTDKRLTGEEKKFLLVQLKGIAPTSDRFTYRTAIWILGTLALTTIGLLGAIYLTGAGTSPPEGLIAIASGAVGGLAGVLSTGKATSADTHP